MSHPQRRPLGRRRRRLAWTAVILLAAGGAGVWIGIGRRREARAPAYRPGEEHSEITRTLEKEIPPDAPLPRFTDVTAEAGLGQFRSFAGPRSSQLPEDMGPGAAWGDYDADGDDDLFLVSAGAALGRAESDRAPSRLYENLGGGRFREAAHFPDTRIIGMGAAWADYDGDGRLDLVLTGYNTLRLFRNEGGRFSREARFPEPEGFWAGASWGDYDNDRDLDLYVCGYVRYVEADAGAASASQQYGFSVPYTLNPSSFQPERNLLFRNNGDGTFTEVAEALKVSNPEGRSLSALWHDFDDDGWLDLYIANDVSDNVLYRNRGGRFEDISHAAWVADYRGAMGLAAADWNRDGDDDLFVSHWVAQENALYESLLADARRRPPGAATAAASSGPAAEAEPLHFMDNADARGVGYIALQFVGWGTEFADFDSDGWQDLVVANGGTFETEERPPGLRPQEAFLFWNRRGEYFHNLALRDPDLGTPRVGRGLAVSDYDGDGDLDLLIACHAQGVVLLRNDMPQGNRVQLRLQSRLGRSAPASGRGEGTKLVARVAGAEMRRTIGGASYLSQSSNVVHFGLGDAGRIDLLEVRWLGGETAVYEDLQAGALWDLREGDPRPRRSAPADPPPAGAAMASGPSPSTPGGHPSSAPERARVLEFWNRQRAAMHAMKVEKDIPKAIDLFRQALEIDPAHEDSLYYLGSCLAARGDLQGALQQFERLVLHNPHSQRGFQRWGTLRALFASSAADLEEARRALERALSINPEETGALLVLGEIELLRGRHGDAEKRLAWACRTNPKAAGGLYLRAYIAWKDGQEERARDLLAQARRALGEEWKPGGATAEGDVLEKLHTDITPLSRFWEGWDGSQEPRAVFASLDAHLAGLHAAGASRSGPR